MAGKIYLHKREFLSKDKNDKTVVDAVVRRYDFGGYDAIYRLSSPASHFSSGGLDIVANPDNEDSLAQANEKIDSVIESLKEFREALNTAAKDSRKSSRSNAKG